MQTCYGITHDRLAKFYQELRSLGVGPVEGDPYTKALLFLSGLHYAVSYYKAASSGSEFETYYGPAHKNEDGLDASARVVLKRLMLATRTRLTTYALKFRKQKGPLNEGLVGSALKRTNKPALKQGRSRRRVCTSDIE